MSSQPELTSGASRPGSSREAWEEQTLERGFVTCSTECTNQDGTSVLTGEATVLLDAKE